MSGVDDDLVVYVCVTRLRGRLLWSKVTLAGRRCFVYKTKPLRCGREGCVTIIIGSSGDVSSSIRPDCPSHTVTYHLDVHSTSQSSTVVSSVG
jgi:hypothetical protein